MVYSRFLTDTHVAQATSAQRAKRGRFSRVVLGVVTAALSFGPVEFAAAQTTYHRLHTPPRDYMAEVYPGGFGGPAIGNWRYGVSAHRPNDRAYPMTESAGPATATGGPSGGIN